MLSLASLLNPSPQGSRPPPTSVASTAPSQPPFLPSPTISSPGSSHIDEASPPPRLDRVVLSKFKMPKEPISVSKTKPRGTINFYPFENVDEISLREIQRFQVTSFGQIQNSCTHIPYNSGKKDFYDKTGRESFEVFKYEFKVPGSDIEYTIMWDYNIGLVRMTPFFKCCKYGKTMPSRMLGLNPGLKEISHSITGGAIAAQGYWMPYNCAKAVCATFCYEIAGALIPIFGPSFPSLCVPPGVPEFQYMAIDPRIVYESQREAQMWRRDYYNPHPHQAHNQQHHNNNSHHQTHHNPYPRHHGFTSASIHHGGYTSAPSGPPARPPLRSGRDSDRRLRVDTRMLSPYSTDTDTEGHVSAPDSASSSGSGPRAYSYHPTRHNTSWTAANHGYPPPPSSSPIPSSSFHEEASYPPHNQPNHQQQPPPNPWLSAVPRFAPPAPQRTPTPRSQPDVIAASDNRFNNPSTPPPMSAGPSSDPGAIAGALPSSLCTPKRRLEEVDAPHGVYDVDQEGYEAGESQNGSPALEYISNRRREAEKRDMPDVAERKAALLLMNLSVRDTRHGGGLGYHSDVDGTLDHHRDKRRRATST